MVSYDVNALFTSVLVNPGVNIVQSRLHKDPLMPQRSSVSIPQITALLEFSLKKILTSSSEVSITNRYIGKPWGSPISPLITNLFIEEFKVGAIGSSLHPPHLWLRFVDDTLVIQQTEHCHQFLQHITPKTPLLSWLLRTPRKIVPYHSEYCSIQGYQPDPYNHNVLQIYPQRPTPMLGQQPFPCNQTQHAQHLNTQGQDSVTSQPAFQQDESHIRQSLLKCNFPERALNNLQTKFHHWLHMNHIHSGQHNTTTMVPQQTVGAYS